MSPLISRATVTGILATISVVLFFGCNSQNPQSYFDPQTGKHPADWVSAHPLIFLSDPSKCYECHGTDLHGGISKVSCFSASFNGIACHPNGPGHPDPAAWANPDQHGAAAKAAPNVSAMHGFSTCQLCHGSNFTGGFSNQTCLNTAGCHGAGVMSPHSQHWLPTDPRQHNTTDPGNASVCALCHAGGKNSPIAPPPAPAPGTPPGCYNNTLCHGVVGHPAGWADPTQHGAHAKAAPNASTTSGFSICQTCHGDDFTGGAALQTCLTSSCHPQGPSGLVPPHAYPWLPGDTYVHYTTDPANGPVCALCHLSNRQPPSYLTLPSGTTVGCFNNTICHGANVGSCVTCHATTQNGRRVITGSGGDFVKADHHVTNGTTTEIVNDAACEVCHGNLITAFAHPAGVPPSPAVQLLDPDSGTYVATTPAGIELACSKCHDSNGATRLGGSALTPFDVAGDTTPPPNINWTAAQQAHSVNGSFGGCLACHGDSGSPNGHGSSQAKMMQFPYSATIAAYLATNASNFCYNCHGSPTAHGAASNILSEFNKTRKHSSETCFDCHNHHQAKAGNHASQTNLAGGVLNGVSGAKLTTNPGFWAAPAAGNFTATTIISGTDIQATLCFKCHTAYSASYNRLTPSGSFNQTDIAREFNPNNVGNYAGAWAPNETAGSFHPVLAAATNNLGRTNNITTSWTTSSLMTCSDCHGSDSATDPNGPHGSAANFILKGPNTTWNTTITLSTSGMPAGTFCANCHNANFSSSRFSGHTNDNHSGLHCADCHVMIPHGSEHPGLLHSAAGSATGVPVPNVVNSPPYNQSPGPNRLYIKSYPANNGSGWGQSNCGCNGTGHGG